MCWRERALRHSGHHQLCSKCTKSLSTRSGSTHWSKFGENLKLVSTERSYVGIGTCSGRQPPHKPIPCTTKVKRERLPRHLLAFVFWHFSLPGAPKKVNFFDQCAIVSCFLWKSAPSLPGNSSAKLSWGDKVPPPVNPAVSSNVEGNHTGVSGNSPLAGRRISEPWPTPTSLHTDSSV